MNECFVAYKNLEKTDRILFFNNICLFISNNLLNTHTHTHTHLNRRYFTRVIYKIHFIYTSIAHYIIEILSRYCLLIFKIKFLK